jgi:thioredoxin reductase (NADPH)
MSHEYDIVIAGGGLAGLTAGLTAARLGRKTLVLTGDVIGGQLLSIEKIEGFPGFPDGVPGYDLAPMTQEEAASAGAEFAATELTRLTLQAKAWRLITGEGELSARAVILATGSSLKELGVPGEARLRGQGVSHCASCDAPLLRQKIAAVVGGGDSAMQEALTLAQHVSQVAMLTRGPALTGQASYRDRVVQNSKIVVRTNVEVQDVIGDAKVTGVRMRDIAIYRMVPPTSSRQTRCLCTLGSNQIPRSWTIGSGSARRVESRPMDRCARNWRASVQPERFARARRAGLASSAGDGAAAAIAVDRYLTDGVWQQEQTR